MREEKDIFNLYNDIDTNSRKTIIIDSMDDDTIINIDELLEKENNINNFANGESPIIQMKNVETNKSGIQFQTVEQNGNNNVNITKPKKNKKTKIWVISFGILDTIAIVCLFLMYGPISYFRDLWVTSALTTATHEYLAYIFFDSNHVNKIMQNNVVIESTDGTNKEDIEISVDNKVEYESIYEQQILEKDPQNDLYKVIDIEGKGYKGHLLVIYDPSRIDLVQASNLNSHGGKQLKPLVEINNGIAGINASGFTYSETDGYILNGIVIMNNKIVCGANKPPATSGGIIGFTNDNVLVLTKSTAQGALNMGIRDAVTFGPFLIVNGVPSTFKGNGGYGIAPRTAIGQRKDGIVLLLVIDGRKPGHSLGVDMVELTNIFLKYGAYNASNLDGGGSSSMVVNGEILSVAGGFGYSGERYIPNAWIVK